MEVYWTVYREYELHDVIPFIRYEDPECLFNRMAKMELKVPQKSDDFRYCPAVKQQTQNTYILKFPFDYNLKFDSSKDSVSSNYHDQLFFDNMVQIRSSETPFVTFHTKYLFMSEEPLGVEATGPYFSNNEFVNKCMIVPGQFDIGNWCRPLDCTFMMKEGQKELNIHRGDDWLYLKFLTDEKVKLRKFYPTERLNELVNTCLKAKSYKDKKGFPPLEYWYTLFRGSQMNKEIIKEIRKNLLDN